MPIMKARRKMTKPKLIFDWRQLYTVRNEAEVSNFVKANGFLPSVLSDGYQQIARYFSDSKPTLALKTDPEDGYQQLVISVPTRLTPAAALSQLEQFDKDWWLDALRRAQGKVCINLAYR